MYHHTKSTNGRWWTPSYPILGWRPLLMWQILFEAALIGQRRSRPDPFLYVDRRSARSQTTWHNFPWCYSNLRMKMKNRRDQQRELVFFNSAIQPRTDMVNWCFSGRVLISSVRPWVYVCVFNFYSKCLHSHRAIIAGERIKILQFYDLQSYIPISACFYGWRERRGSSSLACACPVFIMTSNECDPARDVSCMHRWSVHTVQKKWKTSGRILSDLLSVPKKVEFLR